MKTEALLEGSQILLVRVNAPTRHVALAIAECAVTDQLASCVNISGPITSVYRWEGKIETGEEWVVWIKTANSQWFALEQMIVNHHPDEVPAIIAWPVPQSHQPFAEWLHSSLL